MLSKISKQLLPDAKMMGKKYQLYPFYFIYRNFISLKDQILLIFLK